MIFAAKRAFMCLQGAQDEENDDAGGGEVAAEGDEEEVLEEAEVKVWDEEDEIEMYFKEKSENGRGDEVSDLDDSGSDSDEEEFDGGAAKPMGENPSLDDLNAETQRILRGKQRLWILHYLF